MENRQTERKRTFKGGKIVFNHGRSIVDCTINNMSRGGAALSVESVPGIANEFILVANPENVQKACRLAWKTQMLIGIAYFN